MRSFPEITTQEIQVLLNALDLYDKDLRRKLNTRSRILGPAMETAYKKTRVSVGILQIALSDESLRRGGIEITR